MTQGSNTQINFNIDPTQYEVWGLASGNYITESGKYPVIIVDANYEPTASNANNWKLSLTLQIIAGKFKDKLINTSLNIAHSDEKTRNAGLAQLTSYCTAMGMSQAWNDASVLFNKPFQIYVEASQEVSQSDANKKYWKNDIKNWFYANGEAIKQGVFASGAQLQVVFNGDAAASTPAPSVPTGTIAPPAQPQVQQAAPQGYGQPQQPVQQPVQQQAPQGGYAPQAPAQGYAQPQGGAPNFGQPQQAAAPQGAPAFAGAPTGAPQGGAPAFGAPPTF